MQDITIIILTKNEEEQIKECLESCKAFENILVIDSHSTDKTCDIATSYNATVLKNTFTDFRAQRQFGIDQTRTNWLFFLDADERLTPALSSHILEQIQRTDIGAVDYPRKNLFLDKWIKHCNWYPDYQTRLFQKTTIQTAEKPVHERFQTTGTLIQAPLNQNLEIQHNTYQNLSHYFNKINHYTTIEATHYQGSDAFTLSKWGILSRAWGMFSQTFFHFKGYKDGMHGFIIAGINAVYSFMLMVKMWENEK